MNTHRKIVLFGAGSCGKRHAQEITDEVLCFVDNDVNKQGRKILGKPVIAPSQISEFDYDAIVIASIYESEIRRQLIQLGLGDKISKQVSRNGGSGMVPVNFNEFDCRPEKIVADAQYALAIATGYVAKLEGGLSAIRDKNILELGPGINFGTALCLLCWGAQSVTLCDRFLSQYDEQYHKLVYQKLAALLAEQGTTNLAPLALAINQKSHKIPGLVTVQTALEELASLFPKHFDVTLSNAVFEHLYNPVGAFESLYDCMAVGAVGSHQVDFRDHRSFDSPLEFLLLDELSFNALMHDACCEFGNRVRHFQMQAMFEKAGFKVLQLTENMFATDEYMRTFMPRLRASQASTYCYLDEALLKPISANFIIQK